MPEHSVSLLSRSFVVPLEQRLFENCHASTLVLLPNGEKLTAFFGGRREGAGDVAIWLARGDGRGWQPPRRLMAEPGLAHWNPVLLADGETVWLFYKVGATVHDWVTRWSVSRDSGATWSPPAPLVAGETAPRGPVRNKILVMSNGEWLACSSVETETTWDAFVDISGSRGAGWQRVDIPFRHQPPGAAGKSGSTWAGLSADALWETDPARVFRWDGVIQPSAWESAPGRVHLLMRSTRGVLYRADSPDFGRSWNEAHPTGVPNNNSGIDLVQLSPGRIVLVCNPVGGNWGRRSPLSVLLSDDNGDTFRRVYDLETGDGEFSYPAVLAIGKDIHLTYTYNRKSIVYCHLKFAEE
ncbi:MAG: exo-alpha-sialidase [Methylobacteriaceae bacterium]|nr:exo-alpha-sialidase [Methylobacteriaceae bacterium]